MTAESDLLHGLRTQDPEAPPLDLSWLDDSRAEWGIAAKPEKRGLTFDDINIGSYTGAATLRQPDHAAARRVRPRRRAAHGLLHPGRGQRLAANSTMLYAATRTTAPFGQSVAEALIILLGKGDTDEGSTKFLALQKRQANEYMHRLAVAGLGDRRGRMDPNIAQYLDPAPA